MGTAPSQLTERQQKWFASVREGLTRDTGKSIEQWVAIAKACPETKPKARQDWLREHHGLGQNRAAYVLSEAFPTEAGWDNPDELRAALWTDAGAIAILEAIEAAVAPLPGLVVGQRKGFTAFSNKVQFAAVRPLKDGRVALGLALEADASPRLEPPKNEGWSERLKAKVVLASPADVNTDISALLSAAFARS